MDEEKLDEVRESRIAEFVSSEAWQHIRESALTFIETLESVKTLPNGTNAEVGEEAKVRARAIGLILTWLHDVESIKEQKLQDGEGPSDPPYIRRF